MAAAEIPLQLRDGLFALFADCLGASEAEAAFRRGVEKLAPLAKGSWTKAAYLDDRVPRYLAVLRRASPGESPLAGEGGGEGRLQREVRVAALLFNEGLFFDAHEFLEPSWKASSGREKRVLQGLIQAGAGFHKLELGSASGCSYLLTEAAEKLEEARGAGLKAFAGQLRRAADMARRGELTEESAPKLADAALEL